MNEIDAIKNIKSYMYYALDELPRDVGNALTEAMVALREKAERSKMCEYCDDNFKFWQAQISGELPNVRFCPMCGKRLEEKHE